MHVEKEAESEAINKKRKLNRESRRLKVYIQKYTVKKGSVVLCL
jgi:hypothetical protein